ncbi:restriction endonuclease subunit S [Pseudomonas paraeruginosa]|uniref:restriction endonuclease subunit S n=1 Tax=Pseudomonas paraeruginosa TaxID=2994495 RepID=UPI0039FBC097|nr:restriction endonuclease subunit S [Pseudomonas aeruginosa]
MSGHEKRPLVPRLRFPEFRDAGEWITVELGKLSRLLTERVGSTTCTPYTIISGVGLISQEEKLGRTIAGNSLKNYLVLQYNDFAYNKSATKAYPQGFIALYTGDERAAVPNSIFTCFRVNQNQAIPTFLDALFTSNLHGKWLRARIAVGARAHGSLQVSDDDLMTTPVPLPNGTSSLEEQQKIADSLSSLDDLIAAETQKLDTLKTHKKGLMQQLFPREGETVPLLRFPEFREAGEWATKTLAELAENLDNRRVPVTEKDRTKGNIPYYGASGIVDYIRDFIFDEDLLCISEDGANLRARTAPIAFSISGKTWVNNHAHVLRFDSKCVQKIVEDYLNSISLEDYLTGMAQPKLNRAMLDTIPVPVPQDDDEQQAVSDCLSSLDDLITAQSQKIDAIKIHKKGLIQQLFPVLDEVPA